MTTKKYFSKQHAKSVTVSKKFTTSKGQFVELRMCKKCKVTTPKTLHFQICCKRHFWDCLPSEWSCRFVRSTMCSGGMACTVWNVPELLLTLLIVCPRVSPEDTKMKVLDEFGDEVGVLYYGSTIVFSCKCFDKEPCADSKIELKLMRNGSTNPVDRTMNHTWKSTVEFNVKVDHKFVIDSYYCVIGNNEYHRQKIDYFLCRNDYSTCSRDSKCDRTTQSFCVVRRTGTQTCTKLTFDECKSHSVPTCNMAMLTSKFEMSQCISYAKNEKAVSAVSDLNMCYENNNTMEPLNVACSSGNLKNVTLCEKNSVGAVLWCEPIARCGQAVPPEKFENRKGFLKTKLIVTGISMDDKIASAFVFIIVMGEFTVHLNLPEGECDTNATVKEFDCTFEGLYNHPPEFSVSLGIRLIYESRTHQPINSTDSILGLRNQLIEGPGKYECTGVVRFTSCGPFDEQLSRAKTEVDLHKSCVPPNLLGSVRIQEVPEYLVAAIEYIPTVATTNNAIERDNNYNLYMTCIILGFSLAFLIVLLIGYVFYVKHNRPGVQITAETGSSTNIQIQSPGSNITTSKNDQEIHKSPKTSKKSIKIAPTNIATPPGQVKPSPVASVKSAKSHVSDPIREPRREPELIKIMNEGDDANKDHILEAKNIKELALSLMQTSDNFGAARKYVAHWFGTLEKDNENFVKTNLTVPVKDCKYEDLQCFKHSQIRDLHVNRLNDWRCNPVYLSTAPTKKEFARFWEMIALERIGTIVWVGGFVEKGEARIEPYVSLIQGRTIIFKDDKSPMKANIKTVGVFQHEHRYTTYTIRVRIEGSPGHGELKAMVSVMHIPTWPAMDIPPMYQAYNLNEECGFIEGYQLRRGSWPGLLFHCNNGVQKSAAMLVLYICRQIYMERRKVNLMGVIRYVRAARFGAFSFAPSGYIQVPIILTVLGAVDKAVKEDKQMDYSASASSISVASSKSIVSEAKPSPPPKSVDPGHTYLKLSTLSFLSVEKLKKAPGAKSVVGKEKSTNKASKQAKSPTSSQSPTSKSPVVSPYLYA